MDNYLLARLQNGDKDALAELYSLYRQSFIHFASKYYHDQSIIFDVYQDAVIALYEKAIQGKLELRTCNLKTYLFSIGKFMLLTKSKKDSRTEFLDEEQSVVDQYGTEELIDFYEEADPTTKLLEKSISMLGEKCQELLRLFYYEEKNIQEIRDIMGYNHSDVVKSQKSRCLKSLKESMNTKAVNTNE